MSAPKFHKAYNTEGEGGRPKIYTDEFIEDEAIAFLEWMKLDSSLWYEDFAFGRGYSPQRLSEFAKQNKRFSEVLEQSKFWQKSLLIKGGLLNKYNSSIVKLVLANTIGWTDKAETKVSGDAVNPLNFILQNVDGQSKELVDHEEERS